MLETHILEAKFNQTKMCLNNLATSLLNVIEEQTLVLFIQIFINDIFC